MQQSLRVPLQVVMLLAGLAASATCAPIVIGSWNTHNVFPFGHTSGPSAYRGGYQQVYQSAFVAGPALITQIAFAGRDSGTFSETFTISSGTTDWNVEADYEASKRPDLTLVTRLDGEALALGPGPGIPKPTILRLFGLGLVAVSHASSGGRGPEPPDGAVTLLSSRRCFARLDVRETRGPAVIFRAVTGRRVGGRQ